MRPTYTSVAAQMTKHVITRIYPDTAIKAFRCGRPDEMAWEFFVIVYGRRVWFTGDLYDLTLDTSGRCGLAWLRGKPGLGYFMEKVQSDDVTEFCTERAEASVVYMLECESIGYRQAESLRSSIVDCDQWSPPKEHPWYEAFSEQGLETEDAAGCMRPTDKLLVQYYALQRFVELFNEWEGEPQMVTLQCDECGEASKEMDEHLAATWACLYCRPSWNVKTRRPKYTPRPVKS